MRIAYLMHNKSSKPTPYKPPSTWYPKSTPSTTLENYLEAIEMELAHIRLKHPKSNMTRAEESAIKKLKKPRNRHKNHTTRVCITNRADYLKFGFRHLASEHYEELKQDITMETAHMVHNVLI